MDHDTEIYWRSYSICRSIIAQGIHCKRILFDRGFCHLHKDYTNNITNVNLFVIVNDIILNYISMKHSICPEDLWFRLLYFS